MAAGVLTPCRDSAGFGSAESADHRPEPVRVYFALTVPLLGQRKLPLVLGTVTFEKVTVTGDALPV